MLFSTPEHPPTPGSGRSANTPSTGLRRSLTALAALCAKKAALLTKKLKSKPSQDHPSPRSPLARPKKMLKTISQSAMNLVHKKRTGRQEEEEEEEEEEVEEEEKWGQGGVWQRGILMGDKCQPLDFSGAIYYDSNGHKMDEPPLRSPRASPLPGYLLRKSQP
ncbi:hypothetical protein E5676_scaffold629G00220 [Cucumis melo var. makuwa]|uniref:Uncharacterized protein n=1 Tax=Cucumis melo var. makuwa TaxID=1194695 RepID=A0A5D3DXW4_CUCMM|nr:hypothetical protein E5676_scaffold629G00220 [Cucumis melo var. makuwa]